MSIRDVELLRRWFVAYERGDVTGAREFVDEHFRLVESGVPDQPRYRGPRGLERWMRDLHRDSANAWPSHDHFLEAGGRVVVLCRQWVREQPQGLPAERRFALACSIEHAQIARLEYFPEW